MQLGDKKKEKKKKRRKKKEEIVHISLSLSPTV